MYEKRIKEKIRKIQTPKNELKKVHKRFQRLFSRIETPGFLYSGVTGRSYIDNAKSHKENHYLLNLDVKDFYPSCSGEYIFKCFHYEFKMSEDVARLLTEILTFKGVIPTGSPSSQIVAFWAYSSTFYRIEKEANKKKLQFSIYVDDICLSSKNYFSKKVTTYWVQKEFEKVALQIHPEKMEFFTKTQMKKVTGCGISKSGKMIVLPNKKLELVETVEKVLSSATASSDELRSVMGQVRAQRRLESSFLEKAWVELLMLEKNKT